VMTSSSVRADFGTGASTCGLLHVNDVAAALADRGERRHPEGMDGDVRIEVEPTDVNRYELLHGPPGHRTRGEALPSFAPGRFDGAEQRTGQFVPDAGGIEPCFQPLLGLL
jgi:hypothetical protein